MTDSNTIAATPRREMIEILHDISARVESRSRESEDLYAHIKIRATQNMVAAALPGFGGPPHRHLAIRIVEKEIIISVHNLFVCSPPHGLTNRLIRLFWEDGPVNPDDLQQMSLMGLHVDCWLGQPREPAELIRTVSLASNIGVRGSTAIIDPTDGELFVTARCPISALDVPGEFEDLFAKVISHAGSLVAFAKFVEHVVWRQPVTFLPGSSPITEMDSDSSESAIINESTISSANAADDVDDDEWL